MTTRERFDSEKFYERLVKFGSNSQSLATKLSKTNYNIIYSDQLIRSSSSPGANYIEAIEAISKKDFIHRLRICRKEIRESVHWLRLIKDANHKSPATGVDHESLIKEAVELIKILSSSIITLERQMSN